ncbi:MAG: gamma-glutamyl-gamma-aminobutyrate hydrolase family protein [Chloroflexi bacterium]|nr:gamma-glutamyl-gamma-aminobutyrate hydrolase family protein [Chloroflexota bacterium]
MIIYVDLEHERLQQQPEAWEKSLARRLKHKYRLEELSGDLCLIVRYERVSLDLLRELNARAVVVSGCATDFEYYSDESLAGLRAVYREAAQPILGFCGGMQLLAPAYGAEIGPLGPLAPDKADPYHDAFGPGMKQERGFLPVRLAADHRLFDGLPVQPTFFQAHYWEVKAPPQGFRVLAESDLCPVQAIAHRDRPIFGVQFHPEEYDEAHPDGRRVLENFLKMVKGKGN